MNNIKIQQMQLSEEQQHVFNLYKNGENIFITGPGGTGKSEIIRYIIKDAEKQQKKFIVTAMTGKAALLLGSNAKTFHSWSGFGLAKGSFYDIYANVMKKSLDDWKTIELIIIDEVSMMSKHFFLLIIEIAKKIRPPRGICGEIQVIFVGDFCQLPPIGNGFDLDTEQFCFETEEWNQVFPIENQIEFSHNFRQNEFQFQYMLERIRKGIFKKKDIEILYSLVNKPIPKEMKPTYICPTRREAEQINQNELSKLNNEKYSFQAKEHRPTSLLKYSKTQIDNELKFLYKQLPTPTEICLCIDAQVMCVVNYMDSGICNGSQGKIIKFSDDGLPIVRFYNGRIKKITFHPFESERIPELYIEQIPLILSWACTVHKCQGATLDCISVNAGRDIFERGQLYVALSRVRTLDGLFLTEFNPSALKVEQKVLDFYKLFE